MSWSASSGGLLYSATVPYTEHRYTIPGLRPSTEYTVNVTAQCQVDTALTSPGSVVLSFTTDGKCNKVLMHLHVILFYLL